VICTRLLMRCAQSSINSVAHPKSLPAHQIANAELCVCVYSRPRPSIAPSFSLLLWRSVVCLRANEIPNFIALQAAHLAVANVAIVIASAPFSQVQQQCRDGISRHSRHPRRGAKTALHERRYNPNLLFFAQAIHIEHNA